MSAIDLLRDAPQPALPSALPTETLQRLERLAVRDALSRSLVERLVVTNDAVRAPDADDLADWLGGEALNHLHLADAELALAVDADLHTSAAWLSGALFHAMDRARVAA